VIWTGAALLFLTYIYVNIWTSDSSFLLTFGGRGFLANPPDELLELIFADQSRRRVRKTTVFFFKMKKAARNYLLRHRFILF
jgi:hypothetical protein